MNYFSAKTEDFNFWSEQWAGAKMQVLTLAVLNGKDPLHGNGDKASLSPSDRQIANEVVSIKKATGAQKAKMLQNSIAYIKNRQSSLRLQEDTSKKRYDAEQSKHEQRLAVFEAKFKNGTLLAEFHDLETQKENAQWAKWQLMRTKEQLQLASLLKIQDGAMKHSQALLEIYGKQGGSVGVAPTAEQQKPLVDFCHESFTEVMRAKEALDHGDTETVSSSPPPASTADGGKPHVQV